MKSAEPNYTKENSLASETDFFSSTIFSLTVVIIQGQSMEH